MGLMERRAAMMQFGPQPNEYIKKGLIMFLDGLNQGNTSNRWIDIVGNRSFTLTNCTKQTDGVKFNGSSSYGRITSNLIQVPYDQGTVEFAVDSSDPDGDGAILYPGSVSGAEYLGAEIYTSYNGLVLAHRIANGGHIRWTGGYHGTQGKHTISLNESYGLEDGIRLTSFYHYSNIAPSNSGQTTIGARRRSSTEHQFTGTIYAIRVYNRRLNPGEMLHNQILDDKRYSLGRGISSDEFRANYTQKKCIVNTNDSYILTNYVPHIGDTMAVQFEYSSTDPNYQALYSAGTGTYQLYALSSTDAAVADSGRGFYVRYFASSAVNLKNNIEANTQYKYQLNANGGSNCYVGQTTVTATSSPQSELDGNAPLNVFRMANGTYPFKGKLYYFMVINNKVAKLILLPCTRNSDGKVGVYDLVSKTFYSSASNNEFTAE